ncbi:hypothetical protein K470DRAFT_268729 [Piedraia hortae CBS 480.64]|uniref:Uncharacterized protein n=1 Tax=Piedraia hortae CBS 480.64 TaxID=1314780 RepID=A0A6A7C5L3_9PEZI|nr:hypothetical protein K470DRAFT_268729 [Piedraia hortae CBS 480.64]
MPHSKTTPESWDDDTDQVPESWEEAEERDAQQPIKHKNEKTTTSEGADAWTDEWSSPSTTAKIVPERRPDKSFTTASRLIAAGIGAKLPKRTAEQRSYDSAMREHELKRREKAKKDREEAEKAKKAIWED